MVTDVQKGTIRIAAKSLQAYEKTSTGWKKAKQQFPELKNIVKLFRAQGNFKILIDAKNPQFLKGQLSPQGQPQGARINQLPNGKILDKAYSLFAHDLQVHDQDSDQHWDVLYQNKGGTYAYCYTLEKKQKSTQKKYQAVQEFERVYDTLFRNVSRALNNNNDHLAVPIYTLLMTRMRVGNEIYYRAHGHKGLTTLKKKDITIAGNRVLFNYIGKDGVPIELEHSFPPAYVKRLRQQLQRCKQNDFVFTSCRTGHPLQEREFKKAFQTYCGKEFYPHIVRSHYATSKVKEFLKGRKKANKEEVNKLYLSIAADLGHKRFIAKEHQWKENYTVTVHHYIQPELVEKVKAMVG